MKKKNYRLTVALIKKSATLDNEIFNKKVLSQNNYQKLTINEKQAHICKINSNKPKEFPHSLYYKEPKGCKPLWMAFFDGLFLNLEQLLSSTPSALLLVKVKKRTFAICFGYSRYFLNEDAIEPLFGMKVVLGEVDIANIRSTDFKALDDLAMQTRRQVAKKSGIQEFGIDPSKDILKQVSGEPKGKYFGSVTGSDFFTFNKSMNILELESVCEKVFKLYEQRKYQSQFAWVDKLRIVRKHKLIEELDQVLLNKINRENNKDIKLSFPSIIDYHDLEFIKYRVARDARTFGDIDINDYYEEDKIHIDNIDMLKRKKIFCKLRGRSLDFLLYKCISLEVKKGGKRYFLSEGNWYEIHLDFVKEVVDYCKQISRSSVCLPGCNSEEYEGDYNERVGRKSSFYCLDRKLVKPQGASSSIEFCDIISKNGKQLIHVKKRTSSSTLSHLFNQGLVSADLFRVDKKLRNQVREKISIVSIKKTIPVGPPDTSKYEVVYVIITDKFNKSIEEALPIFSLVCLKSVCEKLKLMGYKVSIALVEQK